MGGRTKVRQDHEENQGAQQQQGGQMCITIVKGKNMHNDSEEKEYAPQ
jgi:hypothetical protein